MSKKYEEIMKRALQEIKNLRAQLEDKNKDNRIAVIGTACHFPGGIKSADEYFQALLNGQNMIKKVPNNRWNEFKDEILANPYLHKAGFLKESIDGIDNKIFRLSPRETERMDPQQKLLLKTSYELMENSGYAPDSLKGSKTGVYIGTCLQEFSSELALNRKNINKLEFDITGSEFSFLSGRISYIFGLTGPSITEDTACSSSLLSVNEACKSLIMNECNMAIAGGVNIMLTPEMTKLLAEVNILSKDCSLRCFDKKCNGTVRGEGCGLVMLKRLSDAEKCGDKIYAVINSSYVNQDGASSSLTAPYGPSQYELIEKAWEKSGLKIEEADFIETHGTGTNLGDKIEINELYKLTKNKKRQKKLYLGSVKSNIGHLEGASGIASLIKTIKVLQERVIPKNINITEPSDYLNDNESNLCSPIENIKLDDIERITAGVSSFGLSGTNVHVVLSEYKNNLKVDNYSNDNEKQFIKFSANSDKALYKQIDNFNEFIKGNSESLYKDIAYSMNISKADYEKRLMMSFESKEELLKNLNLALEGQLTKDILKNQMKKQIVFMFTGQGSQSYKMMYGLYKENEIFRKYFNKCNLYYEKIRGKSLLDIILSEENIVNKTEYTQPTLFAVEYSIAKTCIEYGIIPDVVLGHSIGEYVAATISEVFSLREAIELVTIRGELMQNKTIDGAMVAVFAEYDVIEKYYRQVDDIYVATTNSREQTVFSGIEEKVDIFYELLKENNIRAVKLNVQKGFHSPLMEGVLGEYYNVCSKVKFRHPKIKIISNVTGKEENIELMKADYWCRHIVGEVKFSKSILNMGNLDNYLFIEIGPKEVLSNFVRSLSDNRGDCTAVYSSKKDRINKDCIVKSYLAGQKIKWREYYKSSVNNYIIKNVPNYVFEEEKKKLINSEQDIIFKEKKDYSIKDIKSIILDFLRDELMISENDIKDDNNLLEYGVSSIVMTKFISIINKNFNTNLKIAALMKECTIKSWEKVIKDSYLSNSSELSYEKFVHNEVDTYKKFDLNEVQYAYWLGRNKEIKWGGVACQATLELDVKKLNVELFIEAINKLVKHHDMLRCNISNRADQKIEKNIKVPVTIYKKENIANKHQYLEKLKDEMFNSIIPLGRPMFEVKINELDDINYKIYFKIDFMIFDALSIRIFMKDLNRLYKGDKLEDLEITYRDYLEYTKNNIDKEKYKIDKKYWLDRINILPFLPHVPLKNNIDPYNMKFYRLKKVLPINRWKKFEKRASKCKITPSVALLSLYSEVISAFGGGRHFGIMLTVFNRKNIHKQVNDIIGDFTELLLLEIKRENNSYKNNAINIQKQMYEDMEHSSFSAMKVLNELRKVRGKEFMYPFVFTSALGMDWMYKNESEDSFVNNMKIMNSSTPQVWLDYQIFNVKDGVEFYWDAAKDVFEENVIESMFQVYIALVNRSIDDEDFWDSIGNEFRTEEQIKIHGDVNKTEADIKDKLLYEDYLIHVKERPENIAIICDDVRYTYKQLDERANDYCYILDKNKIDRNTPICINVAKCFEQIASIIGVLKYGCSYIPLTYNEPIERTETIMKNSESSLVITDVDLNISKSIQLKCCEIDKSNIEEIRFYGDSNDIAYIIFTSGSTGKPKGVCISHKSAMNTIQVVNNKYKVCEKDRCFAVSAISFDLSVYDIFGILSAGGTMVIPTEEERKDPTQWARLSEKYEVTIWNSVPQIMEIFTEYLESKNNLVINSISKIILSGDWISLKLPDKVKIVLPNSEITSMGGATEASIWSNYYEVTGVKDGWTSIPYGYPLPNQKFYILDEFNRNCPDFVKGKLFILGKGLAKGYLNDREKTNQAFVLNKNTKELMYDTGDYGRYTDDGSIEFLGREDNQLKVNGYRVEIGEIIEGFNKSGVNSEIIIFTIGDKEADKHLCAVIKVNELGEYSENSIREELKKHIPRYFIPDIIVFLKEFPITINSKIDKKKLMEICKNYKKDKEEVLVEETNNPILRIIEKILGRKGIKEEDNLNYLGISSVDVIRLANQLEIEFGIRPSIGEIISYETVAQLIEFYASAKIHKDVLIKEKDDKKGIIKINYDEYIVAKNIIDECEKIGIELYVEDEKLKYKSRKSAMTKDIQIMLKNNKQVLLKFFKENRKENRVNLTPIQLAYVMGRKKEYELGNLDAHYYTELEWQNINLNKLEQALNEVIEKNEILRTIIYPNGTQQVLDKAPYYKIQYDEFYNEEDFMKKREKLKENIFEFEKWPMFNISISKINNTKIVHFSFDCTILDGVSSQMLLNLIYYSYNLKNIEKPNYTLRQYVEKEKEWVKKKSNYEESENYWNKKIADIPKYPNIFNEEQISEIDKPRFNRIQVEIDEIRTNKMYEKNKKYALTMASVICTAYMKALSKFSKNKNFTVNLTIFNRQPIHKDVDNILGDFTNVTFIKYTEKENFLKEVNLVADDLWKSVQYRSYSGLDVLKKLSSNSFGKVVMPVVFTSMLEGDYKDESNSIYSEVKEIYSISRTPQVALDHQALVRNGRLILVWDYVEQLFPKEKIQEMFNEFVKIVNLLIDKDEWGEI